MARDARRIRVSTAEREQALVLLAEALTDGRLEAAEYLVAEERLRQAVTYADIDAVVGTLDAKASLVERDQAIASIDAAVADGLLDPAERHGRVEAARNATTDAQLAALVADLTANTGSPARVSNADREAVAARLREAVEEGRLDLAQFDERASAVYAARLSSELARLVEDLPEPAAPPAPQIEVPQPAAPRPPARRRAARRRAAPRSPASRGGGGAARREASARVDTRCPILAYPVRHPELSSHHRHFDWHVGEGCPRLGPVVGPGGVADQPGLPPDALPSPRGG